MATVANLIEFLEIFAGDSAEAARDEKKIKILNVAKNEIWRVILANDPDEDWFVTTSQSTTPGNDDYFPKFAAGTTSYALPPNFHELRRAECITSSRRYVRLIKGDLTRPDWQAAFEAESAGDIGDSLLYDITGEAPGNIVLARAPAGELDFRLHYVYTPADWTAKTDSINAFPFGCWNLIADWAATRLMLGINDNRYSSFRKEWEERVKTWVRTSRRDKTGPELVEGFMEEPHDEDWPNW